MLPNLLITALDYYRDPACFAELRDPTAQLPPGLTDLLSATTNILSDQEIAATAGSLNITEQECRDSVTFFIKQVLLDSGGDYYRTLGVAPGAPRDLIKRHYHYLMRLFHPDKDVNHGSWNDIYAPRINEAYNTLRHSARRSAYDATRSIDRNLNSGVVRQPAASVPVRIKSRTGAPHSATGGGLSPRARKVAFVLSTTTLLLFILFVTRQNQQPTLTVEDTVLFSGSLAGSKLTPLRDDLIFQNGTVRLNSTQSVEHLSEVHTNIESINLVARDPTVSPDQRIEDFVKRRVIQASTAVQSKRPARSVTKVQHQAELQPKPQPNSGKFEQKPRVSSAGISTTEVASDRLDKAHETDLLHQQAPRENAVASRSAAEQVAQPTVVATATDIELFELDALTNRFVKAYDARDTSAFAAIFAEDAVTSDAQGRTAIYALYSEFFSLPESRRINFSGFHWHRTSDDVRRGYGKARVSTLSSDGETTIIEVDISFDVTRFGDDLLITGMHYQ